MVSRALLVHRVTCRGLKTRDNATAAVGACLLMRVADDAPEKVAAALCRGGRSAAELSEMVQSLLFVACAGFTRSLMHGEVLHSVHHI